MTEDIRIRVQTGEGEANRPVNERTFRFCCFGNYSGSKQARATWPPFEVNRNSWDILFETLKPRLVIEVELPKVEDLTLKLEFHSLRDFSARGICAQVPLLRDLRKLTEQAGSASPEKNFEIEQFMINHPSLDVLRTLTEAHGDTGTIDLLAMVDLGEEENDLNLPRLKRLFAGKTYDGAERSKLCGELGQIRDLILDQVIADPELIGLHGRWRALKFFLPQKGIRLTLVDCLKSEWCDGTFLNFVKPDTGDPCPLDLAFFCDELGMNEQDRHILFHLGRMAENILTPFILNASPQLFQIKSWRHLTHVRDISGRLCGPAHIKWRKLRDEPGSQWLFMAVNPFVLDEEEDRDGEDGGGHLVAPPAFYPALLLAEYSKEGRWPSEMLHPGRQLTFSSRCLARLDEEQGRDLSFEGFCSVSGKENGDRLYLQGLLCFGQIKIPPREQLEAANLVEYTLPYRFYSGCCSRFLQKQDTNRAELLKAYASIDEDGDFQYEQADDRQVFRLKAPFTIFGVQPDLMLALG